VGFIQGTDGKYRFVIGVPIIIVGFIQGTDGKYRFVIGVPIITVGFIQGTDGKYRFVIGVPIIIVGFSFSLEGGRTRMSECTPLSRYCTEGLPGSRLWRPATTSRLDSALLARSPFRNAACPLSAMS